METGLPWTPNGISYFEPLGIFLPIPIPGVHFLMLYNQDGADVTLANYFYSGDILKIFKKFAFLCAPPHFYRPTPNHLHSVQNLTSFPKFLSFKDTTHTSPSVLDLW